LITGVALIDTEFGWMSAPETSLACPARSANGADAIATRGDISGSAPTCSAR
jgi:hypothetical protein